MNINAIGKRRGSTAAAVLFAVFSGAALAGPATAYLGDAVMPGSQREIQQGDQDPKTPPDCKKFPKDSRCKDTKR